MVGFNKNRMGFAWIRCLVRKNMGVFQFQFLDEFWFLKYVWATLVSLLLLLITHLVKTNFFSYGSSSSSSLSSSKPSNWLFAASASSTPAAASVSDFSVPSPPQTGLAITAVFLIEKVPPGLETMKNVVDAPASPAAIALDKVASGETKDKKLQKRSSRKVLANVLLLLGGIICISRAL